MKIDLKVNAQFDLDRILDAHMAPAMTAGGLGMRYICRIRGRTVKLFNDEGRWFMET